MKLSAVIITKNEEAMIADCLRTVAFADEILVVDTGNTDATNTIAKKHGAKIVHSNGKNYSDFRNTGLAAATGDWLLFVDADERVSLELADEIKNLTPVANAYLIPRKNNYLGRFMKYGGWGGEKIARLFKKSELIGYRGDLHEQPDYAGSPGELHHPLLHYSHRDISSMVEKTIVFTAYEAQLRLAANHPPIVPWRIVRVMFTEFWYRFVKLSAWRDGAEGIIDGLFQVWNTYIIYARLWELQQKKA